MTRAGRSCTRDLSRYLFLIKQHLHPDPPRLPDVLACLCSAKITDALTDSVKDPAVLRMRGDVRSRLKRGPRYGDDGSDTHLTDSLARLDLAMLVGRSAVTFAPLSNVSGRYRPMPPKREIVEVYKSYGGCGHPPADLALGFYSPYTEG